MQKQRRIIFFVPMIAIIAIVATVLIAGTVGESVSNCQLTDAYKKNITIPGFGTKPVSIFYNDYEGADVNDPLAEVITAAKIPAEKLSSFGVANLADNPKWLADWVVRLVVKRKIEKFKTTVYLDYKHALKNAWHLGDCDNMSVYVLVGKDMKIKCIKKIRNHAESKAVIPEVMAVLRAETK